MSSVAEPGTLYVVATPIGNLADITYRAVDILRSVDRILCEDTRVTRALCERYDIAAPLLRHDAHTEASSSAGAIALLEAGRSLALVSDAGTPCVSDPGARLVREVRAAGLPVVPLPGASAVTCAISGAGLGEGAGFHFGGFLPKRAKALATALAELRPGLHAFFAPARDLITATGALSATEGVATLAIGRELTKLHEAWYRGAPAEVLEQLRADPHSGRGEAVMVFEIAALVADDETLSAALRARLDAGASLKDAAAQVSAAFGVRRRRAYQLALSLTSGE